MTQQRKKEISINAFYANTPGPSWMGLWRHFAGLVDLVVPELQNRGLHKQAYRPGSFRQKLFGGGDAIHASHPAAQHKRR